MEEEAQVSHHLIRIGDERGDASLLVADFFFSFLR
jgi:hypothetical protein